MTSRAALLEAVTTDPTSVLLALDFDGTLAPIVQDPGRARLHPGSAAALQRLGTRLGTLAIVTGRPVQQVLTLGALKGRRGLDRLVVCGQYGAERWDAVSGKIIAPTPPAVVAELVAVLPRWLADHGAADVRIEDKGLAVALHTRGLDQEVDRRLQAPLVELADRLGLKLEPGRKVVELRAAEVDKGDTLRALLSERSPGVVVFVGDDLGDLPAYAAVEELSGSATRGFTVASASHEQLALAVRADVVLDGPDGVAAWLTELADAL